MNEILNQYYFNGKGVVIVPGAEIFNHRFPKESDAGQEFYFTLETSPGFLEYGVTGSYKAGSEV